MFGIYDELTDIFKAGLKPVDPCGMVLRSLLLEGEQLTVLAGGVRKVFDLNAFNRILCIGAGKASARMALGLEQLFGKRLGGGCIVVKEGHTEALQHIQQLEASHPLPDERGVEAARKIAALSREADEKTLVINLISGGGSALLSLPFSSAAPPLVLNLEDLKKTTDALLACGADITEINVIRKHLSAVKGGRLGEGIYPATSLNLILSDVVGDQLDTIASGITVPDPSTYSDALAVIKKYNIEKAIPPGVLTLLKGGLKGDFPETPKPGSPYFSKCHNFILGNNHTALLGAKARAEELGYRTVYLSSRITGEAAEAARFYGALAQDVKRYGLLSSAPACLIGGGETTVTLKGSGKGGRNQEMALAFLKEIEKAPEDYQGITFFSGATDGNDGPTDAAGAFAGEEVLKKAKSLGLSVEEYLARNDSYHFFEKCGYLLKTGPTNTNVCDIQIVIIK